jgi:hypothetical protein
MTYDAFGNVLDFVRDRVNTCPHQSASQFGTFAVFLPCAYFGWINAVFCFDCIAQEAHNALCIMEVKAIVHVTV